MNYKDTILKQSQIKWKQPKMKVKDDGNVDLNIHVPLTELLDKQALNSFTKGVLHMMTLYADCQTNKVEITSELIVSKFTEWGLPDKLIKLFKDRMSEQNKKE
jgi:hypothetical protein